MKSQKIEQRPSRDRDKEDEQFLQNAENNVEHLVQSRTQNFSSNFVVGNPNLQCCNTLGSTRKQYVSSPPSGSNFEVSDHSQIKKFGEGAAL